MSEIKPLTPYVTHYHERSSEIEIADPDTGKSLVFFSEAKLDITEPKPYKLSDKTAEQFLELISVREQVAITKAKEHIQGFHNVHLATAAIFGTILGVTSQLMPKIFETGHNQVAARCAAGLIGLVAGSHLGYGIVEAKENLAPIKNDLATELRLFERVRQAIKQS